MLEEILQFMARHWGLSLALVLTLVLLFLEETKNKAGGFRLSLSDTTNLINRDHAVLVDIRDTDPFRGGHIINALNFPHADILNSLEKLKKYKDKPIIVIDDNGRQAAFIANKLIKQGFSKTYCLVGGLQTWLNAGLPLTKVSNKK
jgi:rhodanese-related sulfurtransferase